MSQYYLNETEDPNIFDLVTVGTDQVVLTGDYGLVNDVIDGIVSLTDAQKSCGKVETETETETAETPNRPTCAAELFKWEAELIVTATTPITLPELPEYDRESVLAGRLIGWAVVQ